jgi:hypothetical protein
MTDWIVIRNAGVKYNKYAYNVSECDNINTHVYFHVKISHEFL